MNKKSTKKHSSYPSKFKQHLKSLKYLHQIYTLARQLGLKSTYYLRSQSPEAVSDVADRSQECVGCQ